MVELWKDTDKKTTNSLRAYPAKKNTENSIAGFSSRFVNH